MIEYPLPQSNQSLILSDAVLQHIGQYRQRTADDVEAGGQLFARIEGSTVLATTATGPRPRDWRTRFGFRPNRRAEQQEIDVMFKRGLHYIGDWHTHPEECPVPSSRDIDSMMELFHCSRHQLAGFVMVIAGVSCESDGLYVGVCNERGVMRIVS